MTGTFEPVPLSETSRTVVSIDTQAHPLLYDSFVDYLQLDPSVDLSQRGPDGIQADISIRGASFEQSLVLVNGLRMNDPQSGHHDMDVPFPLASIGQIEVLHGAGSTVYGADAVGGAVNFLTASPARTEMRATVGFGNFGFNQQRVSVSVLGRQWSEQIQGSRDLSTGFRTDSDYRSSSASSETRVKTGLGETDVLLAGSDRPFGADQFYGDFNSWERTKGWFAAISQDLGKNTSAAFGYRRHSDEFVLVRDNPSLYENNHVSQSWQAGLHRKSSLRGDSRLMYGLEGDGDVIDSNNLGHHSRNRGSGYLNADLHFYRRFFLSLGARQEIFSGGVTEFAPTLAGNVWVREGLRLRASASRAFRLPTYTDLYYSDPANIGNPLLKPESAWSFEGGPEWNAGGRISAELTVFRRLDHNDIDYIKYAPTGPWQATNIHNLHFTGAEAVMRFAVAPSQRLEVAYTALRGSQQGIPGAISKYVFDYPSHNAMSSWIGEFHNMVSAQTRVRVVQRFGHNAYPVWDLGASRSNGVIRPYIQFSNLSNTGYEEVPGVAMPGRGVIGGMEIVFVPTRP